MTTDTILLRLRNETRARHEQTETLLYADKIRGGTLERAEYEHVMVIHYLFHQSLESALAVQSDFFADCDRKARQKTPWLVSDLGQLGVPLPKTRPDLFVGWNEYQLLGAMYVAEGATLGGQVIAKALSENLTLRELAAQSQFLGGYGAQTGLRWKTFGLFLTNRAEMHADEIVDAADRAFRVFDQLV